MILYGRTSSKINRTIYQKSQELSSCKNICEAISKMISSLNFRCNICCIINNMFCDNYSTFLLLDILCRIFLIQFYNGWSQWIYCLKLSLLSIYMMLYFVIQHYTVIFKTVKKDYGKETSLHDFILRNRNDANRSGNGSWFQPHI